MSLEVKSNQGHCFGECGNVVVFLLWVWYTVAADHFARKCVKLPVV